MTFGRLLLIPTGIVFSLSLLAIVLLMTVGQITNTEMLAFTSNRTGNDDIFVLDVRTHLAHNLTRDDAIDGNPTWSPDGARLAFTSQRDTSTRYFVDGNTEIYVMNADGSNPENYSVYPNADFGPSWSHDATQIAFISDRSRYPDSQLEVHTMYVDDAPIPNGAHVHLISDYFSFEVFWSPTDDRLLFVSPDETAADEIFILNVDASTSDTLPTPRLLTPLNLFSRYFTSLPAWSPDGQRITFVAGTGQNVSYQEDLYVVNADGGNLRQLTDFATNRENFTQLRYIAEPDWSWDGQHIVFVALQDSHPHLYTLNLQSGELTDLLNGLWIEKLLTLRTPAWSPDGQSVAFVAEFPDNLSKSGIYRVHISDGTVEKLTGEGTSLSREPVWRP